MDFKLTQEWVFCTFESTFTTNKKWIRIKILIKANNQTVIFFSVIQCFSMLGLLFISFLWLYYLRGHYYFFFSYCINLCLRIKKLFFAVYGHICQCVITKRTVLKAMKILSKFFSYQIYSLAKSNPWQKVHNFIYW